MRAVHEFAATYGSPGVWPEPRRQGVRVGRKRVERIMRSHGLQGAHLRRGLRPRLDPADPNHTAAPDLVDRDFRVEAPNRLWVAGLTRLVTGEGVLWLASVRDAFANRIVGWATDPRATAAPGVLHTVQTGSSSCWCALMWSTVSALGGPAPPSHRFRFPASPQSQLATPPWPEHVPWRCWLKLYLPSLHLAVAPLGADDAALGRCTQFPSLFV